VAFGVAFGVAVGVAWALSFTFSYFRLYFYLFELPYQWLLARSVKQDHQSALSALRYSPVYLDELIWLPLFGLDTHLVSATLGNREAGLKTINDVAGSFRQSWAARNAMLEITALDVESAKDIESIADIAQVLEWLPSELPKELESFLPSLRQIAERVQAANESDTDLNRADQLKRAHQEVIALRGSQAWGKARFAQALQVWQDVLTQELAVVNKRIGETFIPQVYISGTPIADQSRMFKGRRDVFVMLEHELSMRHETHPTLLLFGARRSGKTSVLRQLPSRLGPDYIPIEIDLLSATTSESINGLLSSIANQIADKALLTRRIKLTRLDSKSLAADPYIAFNDWLTETEKAIGDKLILLNLDEYERLEEMIEDGRLDRRVFNWLRSLIQSHPKVVVLLSGSHTIEGLSPEWSDALINVRLLRISVLAENEARELIEKPIRDFPLKYDPDAVEGIIKETGRQPYLIQATCRDLVHHLNTEKRRYATHADVELAFNSLMQTGTVYFDEIWRSPDTDEEQRRVMRLLAGDKLKSGEVISEAEIIRRANLENDSALKRLAWRDVIEQTSEGYRLRSGLVGKWIRERAIK